MSPINLIEAHESMNYEEIQQGNLLLPASTPAVFSHKGSSLDLPAAEIEARLDGGDYVLVNVFTKEREGKVYVSGKVHDTDANIRFHVKIFSSKACVFPDPEIPFSAFKRFVKHLENTLGTELVADLEPKP